ncbi:hypothetical protein D3H55_12075 [Bacillus salacetis]|uniref:YpoC-like domain-containing protein n=1 Tax=Bacillus salacetis TaxID=2315464 RepID=A0A3A1R2T3_9BACI|nr:hypothetical protein [Bacillus salacetis]RIW33114.1 hypothetical protein D3H55_12075 [Bacillus salacetis]
MESLKSVPVPREVRHPLFFTETDRVISVNYENPKPLNPCFSYEILYYNGISGILFPWEDLSAIKRGEEEWRVIRDNLNAAFSERSGRDIILLMKKATALFMMYLFWTNGLPANPSGWKEELKGMAIKPVNAEERLEFILTQPSLFHSYKQLNQLFIEQMKHFAKYLATHE